MKTYISLILITLISFGLYAQQNTEKANVVGPKIKFEETTHDFGDVEEGQYAKHTFTFTNEGDRPLLLKDVKPTCGCTASEWTKEPVMPGQSGIVTAVFNSRGYAGRTFFKSISVVTNMSENAQVILFIKGKVNAKAPAEPLKEQSPVRIGNQ